MNLIPCWPITLTSSHPIYPQNRDNGFNRARDGGSLLFFLLFFKIAQRARVGKIWLEKFGWKRAVGLRRRASAIVYYAVAGMHYLARGWGRLNLMAARFHSTPRSRTWLPLKLDIAFIVAFVSVNLIARGPIRYSVCKRSPRRREERREEKTGRGLHARMKA